MILGASQVREEDRLIIIVLIGMARRFLLSKLLLRSSDQTIVMLGVL